VAAPAAICIAVLGTGLVGFLLNIILVLCSNDITNVRSLSYLAPYTHCV